MTPRSHAVCTGALGAIQLSYSPLETHSPWSCRCSAEPTWHHHLSPTPTFAQRFVLPRSGIPAEAAPSYKLHDLLQHELLQQAEAASLQDTTWRRAGFCFKRSHVVSCLLMLRLKLCTNSFLVLWSHHGWLTGVTQTTSAPAVPKPVSLYAGLLQYHCLGCTQHLLLSIACTSQADTFCRVLDIALYPLMFLGYTLPCAEMMV